MRSDTNIGVCTKPPNKMQLSTISVTNVIQLFFPWLKFTLLITFRLKSYLQSLLLVKEKQILFPFLYS